MRLNNWSIAASYDTARIFAGLGLGSAIAVEEDSKVGGQFVDALNGDCRRLGRRRRVFRRRHRRRPQKFLEPGGREHQEVLVLDVPGIAQLVGDAARCHEAIAGPENESLVSYGDLQFSDQDKIRFILAGMRMPRDAHSRRQTNFQKAVCAAGVGARQTDGADTYVEIKAVGSWLMFN
jgi:hypothetical protein